MIPENTISIEPDWLNEVLHKNNFLQKANIASVSHEPWGIGEGYTSDLARLTIKYDGDFPELPETMIAKWPATFESAFNMGMQFGIYEKEIKFYKEIRPVSPVRTPNVIYSDIDMESKKFALILEDCSHCEKIDFIKGLTLEQTRNIILALADFHARWWDSEDLFSYDWMPKPRSAISQLAVGMFKGLYPMCMGSEEFKSFLPEGGLKICEKIEKEFNWLYMSPEAIPDNNLTLVHFDFRSDNIFYDKNNKTQPVLIFDWGTVLISGGVLDVAYLLGGSVQTDLRRKIEKDILKLYMNRLSEKGVDLSDLSFDQVWEFYLRGLCSNLFIPVIAFINLDMSAERAKLLYEVGFKRIFAAISDNDATDALPS